MADLVFTNAYVLINAVDLSDHVRSVTLTYSAEILDDTCMGDVARARVAGLKDWSATIRFTQDFASSKVDATLQPLVGADAFAVAIRPVNTTIATTNPEYQGNGVLESYPIMSNSVGELAEVEVTIQGADGVALIRDTTP